MRREAIETRALTALHPSRTCLEPSSNRWHQRRPGRDFRWVFRDRPAGF